MSTGDDVPQFEYSVIHDPPAELDALIVKAFGLHKSPFRTMTEDDWSFVIKMNAYVEATLNQLLNRHFNDVRLDPVIQKMSMGNNKHGKLGFIKRLDLLPEKAWSFVKALSDLRSEVVHKVEYLNLDLKAFLAENADRKNTWKSALPWWVPNRTDKSGDIALTQPKWYILTGVMKIMCLAIDPSELPDQVEIDELGKVQIYRREIKTPPAPSPTQSEEHHQSESRPE